MKSVTLQKGSSLEQQPRVAPKPQASRGTLPPTVAPCLSQLRTLWLFCDSPFEIDVHKYCF